MNKNTTHQNQTDVINTVLQLLLDHHQDALAEGFRLLVNEAMKAERDYALNADPYERTPPKAPHHHALERLNQELKRRTRVASIFPSESALERLVTALLMEQSEQGESNKTYLTIEN